MINFYAALGLDRDASDSSIKAACLELRHSDPELAREISLILLKPERRDIYDKTHVQYEAMACVSAALSTLQHPSVEAAEAGFQDSNNWSRRLVEFQ